MSPHLPLDRHTPAAAFQITYLADHPEVIPTLATWHNGEWGHLPGARTLSQRMARLREHIQRGAMPTTFVAWWGDEPIGCASLIANDIPELSEWIPWLSTLYVVPEARRHSVGAQLVERVAAEAADLGYPRLYLYTLDQMTFYTARGWRISHVRQLRGHEMTVMTRDLIVNAPKPPQPVEIARPTLAPTAV